MNKTKAVGATSALHLALPPEGGSLSVTTSLEEDAHYLRVTLDKAENFKVAVGVRLNELLINKFANNRNALRDWYEENVVQGREHRAWSYVESFLGVVRKYGSEAAAGIFADRDAKKAALQHEYDKRRFPDRHRLQTGDENTNENNRVARQPARVIKSEYDLRREWLSDMNHLWFKADREWQDRWLQDRRLSRNRNSD